MLLVCCFFLSTAPFCFYTFSLHDALPISTATATEQTTHFAVGYIFDFLRSPRLRAGAGVSADYHTQSHELPPRYGHKPDRKSTRLNSSHLVISYAVFCLKKKNIVKHE